MTYYELFQQTKTVDELKDEMVSALGHNFILVKYFYYPDCTKRIEDAFNKVASERGFGMRLTQNDKGEFEIRKVTRHDKV